MGWFNKMRYDTDCLDKYVTQLIHKSTVILVAQCKSKEFFNKSSQIGKRPLI